MDKTVLVAILFVILMGVIVACDIWKEKQGEWDDDRD